jgi:hypothetical protein
MSTSESHSHPRRWESLQAWTSLIAVLVAAGSVYFTLRFDVQSRIAFDVNAIETICSPQFEFLGSDVPEEDTCRVLQSLPPPTEVRREFVRLMVEHPENARGIFTAYLEIYPQGARWMAEIMQALEKDKTIPLP